MQRVRHLELLSPPLGGQHQEDNTSRATQGGQHKEDKIAECRRVSQSVAEVENFLYIYIYEFSISATPIAECRRVPQHFSTAVSISRKVLQNQNSATLCDTLRHFATPCDLMEAMLKLSVLHLS